MAVATSTILTAAALAVAAGAAGYSAYTASEAASDDAAARKRESKAQAHAAQLQADAEAQAAESRRRQVELQYQRHRDSQRARASGAGVSLSSGSLLEGQMEAAALAEYEAQLAEHPHQIQSQAARYQEKLFGWRARTGSSGPNTALNTGIAAGSTLAAGYGNFYRRGPSGPGTGSPGADPTYAGYRQREVQY